MVNLIFISAGIFFICIGFIFFNELKVLEININLAFLLVGLVFIGLGIAFDEPVQKVKGRFR
jgi:hypothetical protein